MYVGESMCAVLRHEGVIDRQRLAACAFQARDLPALVIDNEIALRHEERPEFGWPGIAHHRAQQCPVAMIDTARETPAAAQAETAHHRRHLADRHVRARTSRVGAVAPELFLHALAHERELPG